MKFLFTLLSLICFSFTAYAQTFDTISKQYPQDAKFFAEDIFFDIANIYPVKTVFEFEENTNLPFNKELKSLLTEKGYTFSEYGIKINYIFDFIDEQRAYLRLLFSDGKKLGIVRVLGDTKNRVISQDSKPLSIAYDYQEEDIKFTPPLIDKSPKTASLSLSNTFLASNTPTTSLITTPLTSSAVTDAITEIETQHSEASYSTISTITPLDKTFALRKGSLMNQLIDLASKEGWLMLWNADYDIDINANASFTGSFIEVMRQLFTALQDTQYNLAVKIYKTNKVVEVEGD